MLRPTYFLASISVFSSLAQAQDQSPQRSAKSTLGPSARREVSRLTNEWKNYFASISTLDMQWQMSGSWSFEPDTRHTYRYHFLGDSKRRRLDTRFYSNPNKPGNLASATVLDEGGYFKRLDVTESGFSRMTARPKELEPYGLGASVPLFDAFGWARDRGSKAEISLATFADKAFWDDLAERVTALDAGKWQGRHGWWLSVRRDHTAKTPDVVRVFVESSTAFPFIEQGRLSRTSKGITTEMTYTIRVTKTWRWIVGGKTRLVPLDFASETWQSTPASGKHKIQADTVTSLAPPRMNQVIAPERWELSIPAKTLVNYAPTPQTKMLDERPFEYNPGGGSLWQQLQTEKERSVTKRATLRAMPVIYDEKADGEAQIAAALSLAQTQNKRVLLQFGAWWCPPCHTLHDLLAKDPTLSRLIAENYVAVAIDINGGHNQAVYERLKGSEQGGIPFLVVLDATGKRLAAPPTEYFASKKVGQDFDAEKLADFLTRWKG